MELRTYQNARYRHQLDYFAAVLALMHLPQFIQMLLFRKVLVEQRNTMVGGFFLEFENFTELEHPVHD